MRKYSSLPPGSRKVVKGVRVVSSKWCGYGGTMDFRQKHANDVADKEMKEAA